MAAEETKVHARDRSRFVELKKSLAGLPLAERVAEEVRLARELGVTVTASEAAMIGRPIERRTRMLTDLVRDCNLRSMVEPTLSAGHEGGQSADLALRHSMAEALRSSPFASALNVAGLRETLKTLNSESNLETAVRHLDPHLELLAMHGGHEDILAEARSAYARTVFAAADPMKSRKGVGGEPNN